MSRKVAQFDAWRTEKADYDINRFYCRAKDKDGHSTTVHVKIPDDLAGELAALVQSGRISDYRTMQDVMRDGLVHRLHWVLEHIHDLPNEESLRSALARQVVHNETLRYQEELAELSALPGAIETVCETALQSGDLEQLGRYLEMQTEHVEHLREPFRTQILSIIDRYGQRIRDRLEG